MHRWIPRFGKLSKFSTKNAYFYTGDCNFYDTPDILQVVTNHVVQEHSSQLLPFQIDGYVFVTRMEFFGDFISVWRTTNTSQPTYRYSCNGCHSTVKSLEATHYHLATGACYLGRYLLHVSYFAHNTALNFSNVAY